MTFEYFSGLVRDQLSGRGVSPETIGSWLGKAHVYFEKRDYYGLKGYVKELHDTYTEMNCAELDTYVDARVGHLILNSQATRGYKNLTPYAEMVFDEMMSSTDRFSLRKIDADLNWEECIQIMQEVCSKQVTGKYDVVKGLKGSFLVTTSFRETGRLSSRLFTNMRDVTLLIAREGKENEQSSFTMLMRKPTKSLQLQFFGESNAKFKNAAVIEKYNDFFWFYKFTSDDGKPYILLSREKLELQHSYVRGLLVPTTDRIKIGENSGLSSQVSIVFVHDCKPDIRILTATESNSIIEKLELHNHDNLSKHIFGDYRHPPWFEKLTFAWLLSGKFEGFPLHLAWVSEAGVGKSYVLDHLATSFQETKFDGTKSTFLGLVPNFGGHLPDEGYLNKCARLGLVDEFFTALQSRGENKKLIGSNTERLKTILQHDQSPAVSGKGVDFSIEVSPKMKVILTGNTKNRYALKSMMDIVEQLDNAFLSRLLWYVNTPEHSSYIQGRKSQALTGKLKKPVANNDFVSLIDYFASFSLAVDPESIDAIFEKYFKVLPMQMHEFYSARMPHHIACLIDGVAKYNYIVQNRQELKVLPEDVEEADELIASLVYSWFEEVDLTEVPLRIRERYINLTLRRVYDLISKQPGINSDELIVILKGRPVEILRELVKIELVCELEDQFSGAKGWFPHWHSKVVQKRHEQANANLG